VLCHTLRDCATILDAVAYPFPGDGVIAPSHGRPYADQVGRPVRALRVGMLDAPTRASLEMEPGIGEAVHAAADLIERLGHHVEAAHPAALDDESLVAEFTSLWMAGAAAAIDRLSELLGRPLAAGDVEPATWAMAEIGRGVTGPDVVRMQAAQTTFRHSLATWWDDGFDLLLTPTCLRTAPKLGELAAAEEDPIRCLLSSIPYAANTAAFNASGQPAISLPLARADSGLPIGIQLVAAYGREDLLFQIAGQLEQEVSWADHRSPLHP
jgi:amidase